MPKKYIKFDVLSTMHHSKHTTWFWP